MANCVSYCYDSCYTGCSGSCKGSSTCSCGSDCSSCGGCDGQCGWNCQGGCGGGCTNACSQGCNNNCSGSCVNDCSRGCNNNCTGGCTGNCKGQCNSGCSNTSYASNYAALGLDTYFKSSDMTNLRYVLIAAGARRGKSYSPPAFAQGTTLSAADMTAIRNELIDMGYTPDYSFTAGSQGLRNAGLNIIAKAKAAYEAIVGQP